MDQFDNVGFSSIFLTPNHPINFHPFIPQSFMRAQADIDDDSDCDGEPFDGVIVDEGTRETLPGDFVIPDSRGEGFAAFYAARTGAQSRNTIR